MDLRKAKNEIRRAVKMNGKYSHNVCSLVLQSVQKRLGTKVANELVEEFDLTSAFGIQLMKEEKEMAKILELNKVRLKKDADLINEGTSVITKIKEDITVLDLLKKFSKKPVDLKKVTLEKTDSKNLKMIIGKTTYMVRKREYEIIKEEEIGSLDELETEMTEEDDEKEDKPVKKPKVVEEVDDDEDEEEESDEDDEEETEAQQRKREKREAKLAKKKAINEAKKAAGVEVEDDEDDEEEGGEKGDMHQVAELLGEDVDVWPDVKAAKVNKKKAKTDEEKEKAKEEITKARMKVMILRGRKLKAKLDKIEERFSKSFRRMFRKQLRKAYGKGFRDQDYGQVYQSFLDL